jgi:type II secretory pathway component PulF
MPMYEYVIADKEGRESRGFVEAGNEKAGKLQLIQKGFFVIAFKALSKAASPVRLSFSDCAFAARQMSFALKSGFTLVEAVANVSETWKKTEQRKRFEVLIHLLKSGNPLGKSFEETGLFPDFFSKILHVADQSGEMAQILNLLAEHYEKKDALRRKWIQSLSYPLILLITAAAVTLMMVYWVFPSFVEMFQEWNRPLPWLTRGVFTLVQWAQKMKWVLGGVLAVSVLSLMYLFQKRRELLLNWILSLPLAGEILKTRFALEISRNLSLLIRSGFILPEALELSAYHDVFLKTPMKNMRARIESGKMDADTLSLAPYFPAQFQKMLFYGLKSGRVLEASDLMTEFFGKEMDLLYNRLETWISPMLIIVMGLIVGVLMLSVVLPIFDWSFVST